MIDKIIDHSDEKTITSFTIQETNIFVEINIFQSSGLIEHIAQSSAARMGIQTIKEGRKPLLGYIASIKNMMIKSGLINISFASNRPYWTAVGIKN